MCAVYISETSPALVVAVQGNISIVAVRTKHDIVMTHLRTGTVRSVVFDIRQATGFDEDAYGQQEQLNGQLSPCVRRLAIVVSAPRHAFWARLLYADLASRVFYDDIDAAIAWTLEADDPAR